MDELKHWGIPGMKWGVRRTPEQLGNRTRAVAKRKDEKRGAAITSGKSTVDSLNEIVRGSQSINKTVKGLRKVAAPKDAGLLSDADLKAKVNRLQMERQYAALTSQNTKRGRDRIGETLDVAGGILGGASSILAIALSVRALRK